MKIWGIIEELAELIFRKNSRQITLKPNDGTYTGAVEIKLPPKLSAGATVLVADDVEQTLTNKVFSNGVIRDNARLVNLEVRNELDAAGNPTLKFYRDGGAYKISMFAPPGLGADYNFSLPNGPGTANYVMRTDGTGVTSWSQIVDASISNSAAISDTKLATISTAGKVANTATTATNLNTASAIVARDASGNFSAGTITANLSGNATSATTATTATSATNVSGTVAIANGGTGQTTRQAAMNALAGTQVANRVLRSDGTNTSLSQVALATDVSGTLPIGNGGTGQTTANAALNALLPSQGSSANKYLKTDGTNTSWASASGGAGEINAILNSSGADGITGWVNGTSHDAPTVITGVNNPLDGIISTAFSFTASAGTASASSGQSGIGIYDDMSLPTALQNRKLKVEFSYTTPASSLGTWAVVLYQGSTRVALSTDSSGDTVLPAGVTGGKFTAYFDSTSASAYRLLLVQRTRISANTLYITNVIVGPGIQPQGAVVGPWRSYPAVAGTDVTAVTTNPTFGNTTSNLVSIFRNGTQASIDWNFTSTTAGTAGSGVYFFKLPTGITIDTTISGIGPRGFGAETGQGFLGTLLVTNGTNEFTLSAYAASSTEIQFRQSSTTNFSSTASTNFGNTALRLSMQLVVPIAEWAGSGTVQLAQNDVEYASNSAALGVNVNDASSFAYGPAGSTIGNITAVGGVDRTVQFQSKIQDGDIFTVEIQSNAANATWVPVISGWLGINANFANQNGTTYGVGVYSSNNSTNQVVIRFGQYAYNTSTYGAAGIAWSSGLGSYKWRVRKSSAGAAVGFGIVQPGVSSGLVSSSGLPGNTSGTAIPAGYVGEIVEIRQDTAQNFTSASYTVLPLTLTAGIWDVQGSILFQINGATGLSGPWSAAITLANSNPNESFLSYTTAPNSTALTQTVRVRYDGTTMSIVGQTSQNQNFVYLRSYPGSFTGGPLQYKYYIRATRVA